MNFSLGTGWKFSLVYEQVIDVCANLNKIIKVDIFVNLVGYFFGECWYAEFQFVHCGNRVVDAQHGVFLVFLLREDIFYLSFEKLIPSQTILSATYIERVVNVIILLSSLSVINDDFVFCFNELAMSIVEKKTIFIIVIVFVISGRS